MVSISGAVVVGGVAVVGGVLQLSDDEGELVQLRLDVAQVSKDGVEDGGVAVVVGGVVGRILTMTSHEMNSRKLGLLGED